MDLTTISSKVVEASYGSGMNYRAFIAYLFAIAITILLLIFPYLAFNEVQDDEKASLRIVTYSSFIQEWGAGPQIAELFSKETGIQIHWINAGNAGLLIERLKFKRDADQPDMVIGFDQFSIHEARKSFSWLDLHEYSDNLKDNLLPKGARFFDFLAYDWGPMTFVFREGQMPIPKSLEDLTRPEYKNTIVLQDPRISSPGLQFLFWVIAEMGEEKGFEFLKNLKPSIKSISPSWSSGYSIFKMQQPAMVFSYFTSPAFHSIEEKDEHYRAATFSNSHPVQVEYAAIPDFCVNCENAKQFAQFLLRDDIQKILMAKNYMYPVSGNALRDGYIKPPETVTYRDPIESLALIQKKKELINQWKKVFY